MRSGSGSQLAPRVVSALTGARPHQTNQVSLATVYKTVATLKDLGEVLELKFSDGHNRYDAHMPQPHPHLICRDCNRIEDHPIDELDRLMTNAAIQSGYQLLSMRLDFYGICGQCSGSATPSPA